MPVDMRRMTIAAVEAAFDQYEQAQAQSKKRRLPAARALLVGAALMTAGRVAMGNRGRGLLDSLEERLNVFDGDRDEPEDDFDEEDAQLDEPEAEEEPEDVDQEEEPEAEQEPEDLEEEPEAEEAPDEDEDADASDDEEAQSEDDYEEDDRDEEVDDEEEAPRRQRSKAGSSRSKRRS